MNSGPEQEQDVLIHLSSPWKLSVKRFIPLQFYYLSHNYGLFPLWLSLRIWALWTWNVLEMPQNSPDTCPPQSPPMSFQLLSVSVLPQVPVSPLEVAAFSGLLDTRGPVISCRERLSHWIVCPSTEGPSCGSLSSLLALGLSLSLWLADSNSCLSVSCSLGFPAPTHILTHYLY